MKDDVRPSVSQQAYCTESRRGCLRLPALSAARTDVSPLSFGVLPDALLECHEPGEVD